jgi:hypothetical protein
VLTNGANKYCGPDKASEPLPTKDQNMFPGMKYGWSSFSTASLMTVNLAGFGGEDSDVLRWI